MIKYQYSIDEVNSLYSGHFIKIFGNVVLHSTAAAIGILKYRPFEDAKDMHNATKDYLDSLKISDKEKILQSHPDMVSRLIDISRLMLEIDVNIEGCYERSRPSVEEKLQLKILNRKYIKKFGFPFISYGKGNFFEVFSEIEKRVANEKEEEIQVSIAEVKRISKLKILELVQ